MSGNHATPTDSESLSLNFAVSEQSVYLTVLVNVSACQAVAQAS